MNQNKSDFLSQLQSVDKDYPVASGGSSVSPLLFENIMPPSDSITLSDEWYQDLK